jgi:hypothetical protein
MTFILIYLLGIIGSIILIWVATRKYGSIIFISQITMATLCVVLWPIAAFAGIIAVIVAFILKSSCKI